ncbi:MAG: proline--tRNA ligase [Methanobacteriota archaeon]|nr:MAG: proline--tRNA ligase [Euryarchaeota archaeon]
MPTKAQDFNEWYNDVVERAALTDKRYPVKGMNVWTGYGWSVMARIDGLMRREMARTGHEEVNFPLLIPETEFRKEAEHIRGFEEEVYWVTRAGKNELDIPMCLRPTSETAMYPIFALWIRSHADLPLKTFQIVSTFRYDTKQTRAFLRVREIHFFEAHTAHVDAADAERQVREDMEVMESLGRELCVPYLLNRRPDWDKFPGAHYSLAADAWTPGLRTLQVATIHHYRDNFAKAYNVTYEAADGSRQFVHQTTYGMSERLLGAVVAIHGDDKGVALPPAVAPVQVVVVPIPEKGRQSAILDEARRLAGELEAHVRVKLDDRDVRPGAKFYEWEAKGVPLRLELGPRDLADGVVTAARRDASDRTTIPRGDVVPQVRDLLLRIQKDMYARAERDMRAHIVDIATPEEAREAINRFGWCGDPECGHRLEQDTGMSILGTPFEPERFDGPCIVCGKPATSAAYLARTY